MPSVNPLFGGETLSACLVTEPPPPKPHPEQCTAKLNQVTAEDNNRATSCVVDQETQSVGVQIQVGALVVAV